jgi:hypothetical protein
MNLIKRLKSNEFALIVAILSVLVQSFHSYTAFYNVSSLKGTPWGIAQAVLFAIVFDLAILFYTVRNKKDVVLGASVFLVLINVYYYYQHLGFQFEFIFGCFLSVIIPVTQYYYSEEIVDEEEDAINPYHYARIIEDKDAEIDKAEAERDEFKREYAALNDAYANLEKLDTVARTDRDGILAKAEALRNSNSVLSETLGRKEREIFELKKRLGDLPDDAEINPAEIEEEIRQSINDKSLLNVSDDHKDDAAKYGSYNPTRTNAPAPGD